MIFLIKGWAMIFYGSWIKVILGWGILVLGIVGFYTMLFYFLFLANKEGGNEICVFLK